MPQLCGTEQGLLTPKGWKAFNGSS